ncbi:MAG TPA: benzoate-CoA ligase family protein [Geobacteraceae bacterium]|nr:benzoate-CoA ligase family protein [Geobacteraceae bacterium]
MSRSNAAVELLSCNLKLHPDKVAYFCADQALSYRELDKACRRFARLLQKQGIAPGERVLIVLPDCFAFPVAFLGCLLSGAVAVAAGAPLMEEDLAYIIEDCEARLLVSHAELAAPRSIIGDKVKVILCGDDGPPEDSITSDHVSNPYQPFADDFAYMLYSSGSTGKPKGVPHRHKSLLLPGEMIGRDLLGITSDDVIFSSSKLSFSYGLINSLAFPLRFGATAILHPGKPDPRAILDIIGRRKPSIFFSAPTIYTQIILSCAEPELKLPMRLCCSAGEALPAAVFEEWQRLTGMEILDGIGSTEMTYHFISNIPGQAVAGSAGRLVPGYRARLVDDDGNDVPSGSEGNLLVSGDTSSPFYWNNPEKSGETMLPDGFIRTGDIFVERNGFYYHRGRSDDMIKAGGHWVSPVTVEDALRSHPAVADCAVAAVSVGTLIKPGAFVVLMPGTKQTPGLKVELRAHVMARLPDYMCPVRFRFIEELPRTSTGKIQRFRLRE